MCSLHLISGLINAVVPMCAHTWTHIQVYLSAHIGAGLCSHSVETFAKHVALEAALEKFQFNGQNIMALCMLMCGTNKI